MANQGYNWNAQDYAKNSQNQFQWAKELIPKLRLQGNESLLDIGCGDGKITAELARCLPDGKAVGVDSSEKMINLAQSSFSQKDHPNLTFQVMDAKKLTFKLEFDVVFSNAALHWIVDQEAVLRGVERSLKPGGRLLFQMAGKGNAKDVLIIVNELADVEPWKGFFSKMAFPYGFYDVDEYKDFLQEAGLVAERVELFPKDMKHNDAEGLAGWVRTTWLPFTDKLPVELRTKFVELVVNCYLTGHPADADGTVHVGMMRIEVEAHKPLGLK
ncbi:MAG: methyltransferase domain-containing protein [Candidatus Bathyarchaeia archaeon]|jgi:trans-aconitate methyltransferase